MSAGDTFTCAATVEGPLRCWGNTPLVPADLGAVKQVSIGSRSLCFAKGRALSGCESGFPTCVVTVADAVRCWYRDGRELPTPDGIGSVREVSAGVGLVCVITTGGALHCWGTLALEPSSVPPATIGPLRCVDTPVEPTDVYCVALPVLLR